ILRAGNGLTGGEPCLHERDRLRISVSNWSLNSRAIGRLSGQGDVDERTVRVHAVDGERSACLTVVACRTGVGDITLDVQSQPAEHTVPVVSRVGGDDNRVDVTGRRYRAVAGQDVRRIGPARRLILM